MNITEQELVEKCRMGNPTYQRMLVDQYAPMLLATCKRYLRDPADAEDCHQDAWVNILQNLKMYQPNGSFKAWMQRIAINLALSKLRRKSNIIRITGQQQAPKTSNSPTVYAALAAEDILEMLDELSEAKRQVFLLHLVDGYKHQEIADMIGTTENGSRTLLARARKELKDKLGITEKIAEGYQQ